MANRPVAQPHVSCRDARVPAQPFVHARGWARERPWWPRRHSLAQRLCLILGMLAGPAVAGSGFLLRSQSATSLGTAQAGMTAAAEDVTYLVFNPAALAVDRGRQYAVGLTAIVPGGHFEPSDARTIVGTPIAGGDGGDPSKTGYIPNLYYATDVAGDWRFGIALTSLHGLGFRWNDGWVGRYHAGRSELLTIDAVPTLSFKPSKSLSLGVALDFRYARAKTDTAVDFGTLDVLLTRGAFGGVPGASDGALHTELEDRGIGYSLGILHESPSGTRIGLSYRSAVRLNLEGPVSFDRGPVGDALAAATGAFLNTTGRAPLSLPAVLSAGFQHAVVPRWWLMGDIQWTRWSDLQRLELSFQDGTQPPVQTELSWRDSWYAAIGVRHDYDDRWSFRAGAAYDQTPARRETSTPALADANSAWVAVGLTYKLAPAGAKIDFAYGHIFVQDNPIALQATAPGNAARGDLSGTIRGGKVDYVAVQWHGSF